MLQGRGRGLVNKSMAKYSLLRLNYM